MIFSTLCYLIQDEQWLMLLRNKKAHDINEGKWIGVGGKFEPGETPRQCVRREVREETGLEVRELQFAGILYFNIGQPSAEKIWVYTCRSWTGTLQACREGTLQWIPASQVLDLQLWAGDRIFLKRLLSGDPERFFLEFDYDADSRLIKQAEREAEEEWTDH